MTLLEQLAALVAALQTVKTLCDSLIVTAQAQQADYAAAVAAQAQAGSSLASVVDLAGQISSAIGVVQG